MNREDYVEFINKKRLDSELAAQVEDLLAGYMTANAYREDMGLLNRARAEQEKADVTAFRRDTDSLLMNWKKLYRRNMEME